MKKLRFALKLAVSIFLVSFIFYKFPVRDIWAVLKNTDYFWLAISFLLCELIILNQAVRWHYLLTVPSERKPEFSSLLKYTVIGYFFNLLAPGGIGGDAYRSVALGRMHNFMASSVAAVFIAKILGFLALCLLFWFALPYSGKIPEQAIWFMAAASLFLIVFCLCIAFNPFKKGKFGVFAEKLRSYKKYPFRLLMATLDSIFMQVLAVFTYMALFKAIGISISFGLVFVAVPVTILITAIPISLNGIGVREWSLLSLTAYTVNSEQILASLLLSYAIAILQAVQGGIFYITSHDRVRV
ncbi:MAG: flippase-like domain-containing protein [Fibromonadales bacterium]|nr:flippase-like domain-containing protein [Fibromonadales bacterium]